MNTQGSVSADEGGDDPVGDYGYVVWFPIMCVTFWALAVVVEEFFVPVKHPLYLSSFLLIR